MAQQISALVQGPFHFDPGTAPIHGNALGQIADNRQENITLKVASLRQVPGDLPIMRKMPDETK
jgi:hypothetical protein